MNTLLIDAIVHQQDQPAWLNWWLKGDETATGKGLLVGAGCPYCSDGAWEYKSMNIP